MKCEKKSLVCIYTIILLLLKYLFHLEIVFENFLSNNILLYLVIFCFFAVIFKSKKIIVLGTVIVIAFSTLLENDYHYTSIVSPENTNRVLVVEYDLPLNSEMVVYTQKFKCFYQRETYLATEYSFYPFFEGKTQYNWIDENQVELKYTLSKSSDFSMAQTLNITF
jgi:hypothetical protein